MLFINRERITDFQDRCVVAIFVKIHKIDCITYIAKNHFIGRVENRDSHIYLFYKPDLSEPKGIVFRARSAKRTEGFRYELMDSRFVEEYRSFALNPVLYIREHFFKEDWENNFKNLFQTDPPENFNAYKYKGSPNVNDKNAMEYYTKFLNGQLTFVNPIEFDDPFDCDCDIQYRDVLPLLIYKAILQTRYSKNALPREKLEKIREIVKEEPNVELIGKTDLREFLETMFDKIYANENKFSVIKRDNVVELCMSMILKIDDLKEQFRVLCLSKNPRDIIMWGYYGDSGKGICVSHSANEINNAISKRGNYICIYGNVTYPESQQKPVFEARTSDMLDDVFAFIIECTFTKFKNWQNEQEFRYILLEDDFASNYIPIDSEVDEYFLGCKSDQVHFYETYSWQKQPKKLKKHSGEYRLVD